MQNAVLLFVFSALAVGVPIAGYLYWRQAHQRDLLGIAAMRVELDSTRAALARAATPADSTALAEHVRQREFSLDRRTYHIPLRESMLARRRRPAGIPTISVVVGAILALLGCVRPRRAKTDVAREVSPRSS